MADSLARIIQETDPAIAGVGAAERPFLSPRSSVSSLTGAILQGPGQPKLMVQTCSNEHSTQVHYHHNPQHSLSPRSHNTGQYDKSFRQRLFVDIKSMPTFSIVDLFVTIIITRQNIFLLQHCF